MAVRFAEPRLPRKAARLAIAGRSRRLQARRLANAGRQVAVEASRAARGDGPASGAPALT